MAASVGLLRPVGWSLEGFCSPTTVDSCRNIQRVSCGGCIPCLGKYAGPSRGKKTFQCWRRLPSQVPCPAAVPRSSRLSAVAPVAEASALRDQAEASAAVARASNQPPDPWVLFITEKLRAQEASGNGALSSVLQRLRSASYESLEGLHVPTTRDELWRFTDLRPLFKAHLSVAPSLREAGTPAIDLSGYPVEGAEQSRVVVVDGEVVPELSNLGGLPNGVSVGSLRNLPPAEEAELGALLGSQVGRGAGGVDIFTALNGCGAADAVVVHVPAGVQVTQPVHVLFYSTGADDGSLRLSSPRLLVVVGEGGAVNVVEEYVGAASGAYFTNAVAEFVLAAAAKVKHGYLQHQAREASHMKRTYVEQQESSSYGCVETGWGGRLTRHTFHVQQLGPETDTGLNTFYLAGKGQLHDLHSSIWLDHPRGVTRQLHKCIVTDSSGSGVFDGNVRVGRLAQQTDAGQLSRNLLLAPRATVNVKPNLQIIADDVKCTHGATISDLEEDQLFYFRARGIDEASARRTLIFSFGCEVVERLESKSLAKRVEQGVKNALEAEGAMAV